MTEGLEQRYCIKFCQKLRNTQAETIQKIQQAFGDDKMRITRMSSSSSDKKQLAEALNLHVQYP
jgi:hypothetical protein